jgi:cytochrome c biogenesis protein CcmG/thiol:disulfide interchange protein DsbE
MRRLIFLAPIVLFAIVVAGFALGLRRDPSLLPSTLIGKPLPSFSLPPVDPKAPGLTSADMTGGSPRLLNVFGSWCVSCRYEHPVLMALKSQGVAIEGLDWRDSRADATRFLAAEGNPYERIGDDEAGRTVIDLGVAAAPETFIVDRQGRVRYKQVGPITPEVWTSTLAPLMARLKSE